MPLDISPYVAKAARGADKAGGGAGRTPYPDSDVEGEAPKFK